MRYELTTIEDQILATLEANSDLSGVNIRTHVGEVNEANFQDPAFAEGFVHLLPFVFVQYQGKTIEGPDGRNSVGSLYFHKLKWRFFVGSRSLRDKKEAQRAAYPLLAAVYDSIHGKWPKSNLYTLASTLSKLEGTLITTVGFNPSSPMLAVPGDDESLIVNLPEIVVYSSDYSLRLMA